MTNKERANRIKKVLEKHYISDWRVADVVADLKHLCDHYSKYNPDQKKDFDYELGVGIDYYEEEKND